MPSASSKSAAMSSQVPSLEGQDPLKVVVSMMEKKVRNLEKRKTRLVSYTQQVEEGKKLVEKDQQDAVKKIEFVENSLELAKEFHQIFRMMEQEYIKLQKKEQKRAKLEMKEKGFNERKKTATQILEVQTLLENIDDDVKEDFRNGTEGACKLEEEDLARLDEIYKLITPSQCEDTKVMKDQVAASSIHLHNLLEEKDLPRIVALTPSLDKQLYGILKKIKECGYFDKSEKVEEEAASAPVEDTATEDRQPVVEAEEAVTEDKDDGQKEEGDLTTEAGQPEPGYNATPAEPLLQEGMTEAVEPELVNGVDLPVEFSEPAGDSAINFLSSEVQVPAADVESEEASAEEGKLNAASPEFIPRSLQSGQSEESGWVEGEGNEAGAENSGSDGGWQNVTTSSDAHHAQNRRGGHRGRDRGGFRGGRGEGRGGRGRGGYGQNNYHQRQERGDNNQRREGGHPRGGRGGRGGHPRGGRGDSRGAPRGNRGGYSRPQQQQQPQQ
eukprot:gene18152-19963_t